MFIKKVASSNHTEKLVKLWQQSLKEQKDLNQR